MTLSQQDQIPGMILALWRVSVTHLSEAQRLYCTYLKTYSFRLTTFSRL